MTRDRLFSFGPCGACGAETGPSRIGYDAPRLLCEDCGFFWVYAPADRKDAWLAEEVIAFNRAVYEESIKQLLRSDNIYHPKNDEEAFAPFFEWLERSGAVPKAIEWAKKKGIITDD
ncbi:MAG: hypothetical protein GWM98_04865 [Nitrospinaceae bacterium]|nr:hypothetical protein [Deltaproteobacteria bacterium]NIY14252.1 hypothetical protein [Nitrospinaceae bacterium]